MRLCAVLALSGCDGVFGLGRLPPVIDAAADATMPEFTPFDSPVPLEGINTNGEDDDATLTADLTEIFFLRDGDLWTATREAVGAEWSTPQPVVELNTSYTEARPAISADGLTIYFGRGGLGEYQIYYATRPSRQDAWYTPGVLSLDLYEPMTSVLPGWSSPDGSTLFVEKTSNEEGAIYVATRSSPSADFVTMPFEGIEFGGTDGAPWATPDRSRLVFASNRSGKRSIWEAVEVDGTWFLHRHTELDSAGVRGTPWLSPDGRTIVFTGTRAGSSDDELYLATR